MDMMLLLTVLLTGVHWIPARQEEFVTFCHIWLNALEDEAKVTAFAWDKLAVMTLRGSACGGRKPFGFTSGIHRSMNAILVEQSASRSVMNFIIVETSTAGGRSTALRRLC